MYKTVYNRRIYEKMSYISINLQPETLKKVKQYRKVKFAFISKFEFT